MGPTARADALDASAIEELRRALVDWFGRVRRDLPWRRTRDAYAVWISEAMLQQTRVETVVPYYERFLARLPTLADLAAASEEEVVALWSGLGYYRRARALRAAARRIVDEHGGEFPRSRAAALALPGVGPYTAGAVLSIAYGGSVPIVDGNVARVFARLFGLEDPLGSPALTRALWAIAERLVPPAGAGLDPGDWNQALMELGATVCTPRAPRCLACPLHERCAARAAGTTLELPRPAPRRAVVDVLLEVLLVQRGRSVLLVRRPAGGRMARMWELPTRELATEGADAVGLWPPGHPAPGLVAGAELGSVAHGITHHRIRATVRRGTFDPDRARPESSSPHWCDAAQREALGLTGLTRKVLGSPFARAELEGAHR